MATQTGAKLTRRKLATLAALAPAPAAVQGQNAAPATDDLAIQRENLQRWREQMAKVKLPMAVEPAVVFKA